VIRASWTVVERYTLWDYSQTQRQDYSPRLQLMDSGSTYYMYQPVTFGKGLFSANWRWSFLISEAWVWLGGGIFGFQRNAGITGMLGILPLVCIHHTWFWDSNHIDWRETTARVKSCEVILENHATSISEHNSIYVQVAFIIPSRLTLQDHLRGSWT
jgi:hypothetical protein